MQVWFTADTHFGHGNIIKYCQRPYRSPEEFDRATNWYAQRGTALGRDFVARVGQVIRRIANNPEIHATVHNDVRKAVVSRFPYLVLDREDAGELIVIGVFHTSRDPSEWQSRVDPP